MNESDSLIELFHMIKASNSGRSFSVYDEECFLIRANTATALVIAVDTYYSLFSFAVINFQLIFIRDVSNRNWYILKINLST